MQKVALPCLESTASLWFQNVPEREDLHTLHPHLQTNFLGKGSRGNWHEPNKGL